MLYIVTWATRALYCKSARASCVPHCNLGHLSSVLCNLGPLSSVLAEARRYDIGVCDKWWSEGQLPHYTHLHTLSIIGSSSYIYTVEFPRPHASAQPFLPVSIMSKINQPISIGTEDPEYYAELFMKASRPANWRLPSNKLSWPDVFGVQNVDDPQARRLQSLLDVVADVSLYKQGNVSATMACVKYHGGTLQTRLYIVFNHENDEAARRCPQHLISVFDMLHKVPYMPPAIGSPKVFADASRDDFIEICKAIHNYSFDIFAHRVTKHEDKLSDIQGYIEQDRTELWPPQRYFFAEFFRHVDTIIKAVHEAQATKNIRTIDIQELLNIYSYWTNPEHEFIPKDRLADESDTRTLLDVADGWLARGELLVGHLSDFTLTGIHIFWISEHNIKFKLRRWALKIMSLVVSANRLFAVTQSRHLRSLVDGELVVQVLTGTPPTTTPYCSTLSPKTIQVALDAALAGTTYLSVVWNKERESFIEQLLNEPEASDSEVPGPVVRKKPIVHPELAMIMAMDTGGKIEHVTPYIGLSKRPCIMCSHYIRAFNEVTKQEIATKGSHGKAYPGWLCPSHPSRDGELRPAFLRHIRQQLLSDFKYHAEKDARLYASLEEYGPRVIWRPLDDDGIDKLNNWQSHKQKMNRTRRWFRRSFRLFGTAFLDLCNCNRILVH